MQAHKKVCDLSFDTGFLNSLQKFEENFFNCLQKKLAEIRTQELDIICDGVIFRSIAKEPGM